MKRTFALCTLLVAFTAFAQDPQPTEDPPVDQPYDPSPPPADNTYPPPQDVPPNPDNLVTEPQQPLTETPPTDVTPPVEATTPVPEGVILDGQLREGAFLSGPGSLAFVLHHSIMGAAAGLVTQGFASEWRLDQDSRSAMLIGTIVGAGLGFGSSAWWQFNHWIDKPMAFYGIANSVVGALFFTGLMDLVSNDGTLLAWTGALGALTGAWLTATLGGGQMPARRGLAMASGAGWGAVYAALLLAIIGNSGQGGSAGTAFDVIAIASGVGTGLMALAGLKYDPTTTQLLRADLFGAGVGAAVLVLSALVLGGFNTATPYVLSLLSATGAITAVSLLWEESAERSPNADVLIPAPRKEPYRTVWW